MSTVQKDPRRELRRRPSGWPVASFGTYLEAQSAVDALSDHEFPVHSLTIVGVDLMEVEQVTGRLTWGKVILGGLASGAWMGLFFGLLFGILSVGPMIVGLLWGIAIGAIFGVIFAAVSYGLTGGARDFTSQTAIVAGRYDILADPEHAERARDFLAARQGGAAGEPAPADED
ncbi:general stress protein [Corynebacterium uterequi]|uniref:General stress protein 17M-like domain-containing protein n=1 Tax=Corynebacterium uterequi TaxID=1072256 RepID=A0A0G3HBR7_9CORY|nr:general stress protein [Corynebacterium uterequi]AKK10841.1 hypothetical protein CUTER_04175 [Corynebacterium uterequi]